MTVHLPEIESKLAHLLKIQARQKPDIIVGSVIQVTSDARNIKVQSRPRGKLFARSLVSSDMTR